MKYQYLYKNPHCRQKIIFPAVSLLPGNLFREYEVNVGFYTNIANHESVILLLHEVPSLTPPRRAIQRMYRRCIGPPDGRYSVGTVEAIFENYLERHQLKGPLLLSAIFSARFLAQSSEGILYSKQTMPINLT